MTVPAPSAEVGRVLVLIASTAFLGCAPSQIGVELSGSAPSDVVYLRLLTCGQDGAIHADRTLPLADAPLPRTIWIDPLGGDTARVFRFSAALLDASMAPLVSVGLIDRFPASGSRRVSRTFDAECLGITCGSAQTCSRGECVSALAPGLALDDEQLARVTSCRSLVDAGLDAGPGDGGSDAGIDGGAVCDTAALSTQCSVADMAAGDCLPAGCELLFGHSAEPTPVGYTLVPGRRVRVNRFDTSTPVRIAGLYVLLRGDVSTLFDVIGVVYSDSTGPAPRPPSALLLASPPMPVAPASATVSEGWWSLPFIGAGVVAEGSYWIGFTARGNRGTMGYHGPNTGFADGRIGVTTFEEGPPLVWMDHETGVYPREISIVAVGTRE